MDRNAPIGVFDSGVGGLTVAREIMRQMPKEKIVYFGDTARLPYGTKSQETVIRYSKQILRFLKTQNVKAIVIACNTASACALEAVKEELAKLRIPLVAEDTGDSYGRTIEFYPESEELLIKAVGKTSYKI